jgi:phosphate starvation-inducible protein PhoH and related proteins
VITNPSNAVIRLKTPAEALALFGENDQNLKRLRTRLEAKIIARGDSIRIDGDASHVKIAEGLIRDLLAVVRQGGQVSLEEVDRGATVSSNGGSYLEDISTQMPSDGVLELPKRLKPKTKGQKVYVDAILASDITFGIGPAGTGKSYLAVAMAVAHFKAKRVKRIILTRPAVEAGERLGFLPGDLQAKIDPYLRPLYDALFDMIDPERFESYLSSGAIEVAPLAFMRGRAQPLTSQILTPLGWRNMGQLEVGDYVIGRDGQATQVLGVYPQGQKPVYRVTMTDGSSTVTCAEHLWKVTTASDKRRYTGPRVLELGEMIGKERAAHQYRYEIPMVQAVEFPTQPVPLEPYALGLLLGDGCITGTTTPAFASQDTELVAALEAGIPNIELVHKGAYDYTLKHKGGTRGGLRPPNPAMVPLRALELAGTNSATKFVPDVYKYNSPEVRLAVVQGLLDTDGGPVTQTGRTCRVQYTTISQRLRDDMVFLVRSLGGVANVRTRKAEGRKPGYARGRDVPYNHDAFVLEIRLPEQLAPFRLTRKLEKYRNMGSGRPMRFIKKIEALGVEETQCIRVAAADHLYVTDDFIVTHNTLNDAFVILDEAQNTTPEQMKMFLTRMGFSSKVVVTGDVTQVDLPKNITSGLEEARRLLGGIEGIEFVKFDETDVVRHPLVARIVKAYETHEEAKQNGGYARGNASRETPVPVPAETSETE